MNKELFKNYGLNNTPEFSLNGINGYARVVDILDGDTIKVILNVFNNFYKFNVRLNGIDTCETKSANVDNKNLGLKAKMKLIDLICDKKDIIDKKIIKELLNNEVYLVYLKCYDFDKYGRLLCDIFNNDIDLSNDNNYCNILIKENLAYKYTGKTKLSEEEQIKLLTQ